MSDLNGINISDLLGLSEPLQSTVYKGLHRVGI